MYKTKPLMYKFPRLQYRYGCSTSSSKTQISPENKTKSKHAFKTTKRDNRLQERPTSDAVMSSAHSIAHSREQLSHRPVRFEKPRVQVENINRPEEREDPDIETDQSELEEEEMIGMRRNPMKPYEEWTAHQSDPRKMQPEKAKAEDIMAFYDEATLQQKKHYFREKTKKLPQKTPHDMYEPKAMIQEEAYPLHIADKMIPSYQHQRETVELEKPPKIAYLEKVRQNEKTQNKKNHMALKDKQRKEFEQQREKTVASIMRLKKKNASLSKIEEEKKRELETRQMELKKGKEVLRNFNSSTEKLTSKEEAIKVQREKLMSECKCIQSDLHTEPERVRRLQIKLSQSNVKLEERKLFTQKLLDKDMSQRESLQKVLQDAQLKNEELKQLFLEIESAHTDNARLTSCIGELSAKEKQREEWLHGMDWIGGEELTAKEQVQRMKQIQSEHDESKKTIATLEKQIVESTAELQIMARENEQFDIALKEAKTYHEGIVAETEHTLTLKRREEEVLTSLLEDTKKIVSELLKESEMEQEKVQILEVDISILNSSVLKEQESLKKLEERDTIELDCAKLARQKMSCSLAAKGSEISKLEAEWAKENQEIIASRNIKIKLEQELVKLQTAVKEDQEALDVRQSESVKLKEKQSKSETTLAEIQRVQKDIKVIGKELNVVEEKCRKTEAEAMEETRNYNERMRVVAELQIEEEMHSKIRHNAEDELTRAEQNSEEVQSQLEAVKMKATEVQKKVNQTLVELDEKEMTAAIPMYELEDKVKQMEGELEMKEAQHQEYLATSASLKAAMNECHVEVKLSIETALGVTQNDINESKNNTDKLNKEAEDLRELLTKNKAEYGAQLEESRAVLEALRQEAAALERESGDQMEGINENMLDE